MLVAVAACYGVTGPAPAAPRIDYVDGAIEPVLVRGQSAVIDGFGFGGVQDTGRVTFPTASGTADAVVPDSASWSDREIRVIVPDSAVSGSVAVTTADGHRYTLPVHVLPRVPFNTAGFSWSSRTDFPQAPVGVALASAEFLNGSTLSAVLYAAGGAEPVGGDSAMVSDSAVYLAHVSAGGTIGAWTRQHDTTSAAKNHTLPVRRAFAAAVVATRFNSRYDGARLYVIGGIDSSGTAQASVLTAPVTADSVTGPFQFIEPLPAPVSGAIAVVRGGRMYVIGGVDQFGRPRTTVFAGRIGIDGHIDGWYPEPPLPAARAFGGGVVLDHRIAAFGGIADSADLGGGLDAAPPRLVTSDTAPLSAITGFLSGVWAAGPTLLPEGRSQFATLPVGTAVLLVGGLCDGGVACPAETLAAPVGRDSLGAFAPAGANTIAGQGGGTVVGPASAVWRESDGSWHGIVVGGMNLTTRLRVAGAWGF
ncbi:MAG TPA: hypothetical protein VI160_05500 [Gemmatimonadales bacterium]